MQHLHSIFISYGSWEMLVGLGPQLPVQSLPHSLVSVGFTPSFGWGCGNPCRKGQHSLSTVNHDLIQMCLKYRLRPGDQDSDTCGAGEQAGLVAFTGIHPLSHLVFCFCWTGMWSVTLPEHGWRQLWWLQGRCEGCWKSQAVFSRGIWQGLWGSLGSCFFPHTSSLLWFQPWRLRSESQVFCALLWEQRSFREVVEPPLSSHRQKTSTWRLVLAIVSGHGRVLNECPQPAADVELRRQCSFGVMDVHWQLMEKSCRCHWGSSVPKCWLVFALLCDLLTEKHTPLRNGTEAWLRCFCSHSEEPLEMDWVVSLGSPLSALNFLGLSSPSSGTSRITFCRLLDMEQNAIAGR